MTKRGRKRDIHTVVTNPSEPGKQRLTKSFVLAPGTNTITVVAYTHDNTVASPSAVRTVQFTTDSTAVVSSATSATPPVQTSQILSTQPTLFMLVVGINRYRDKALWLRYAVPDGQKLTSTVRQAASPLVRDVKVTTLFDEQAIMAELEAAFARVTAQTSTHDIFLLYLAGHGITLDGRYHFIPRTFTMSIRMPYATMLSPRTICSAGSPRSRHGRVSSSLTRAKVDRSHNPWR